MADSLRYRDANAAVEAHSATCSFCSVPNSMNEPNCPEKNRLYEALLAAYQPNCPAKTKSLDTQRTETLSRKVRGATTG